MRIVRFRPVQRIFHALLMLDFLWLSATGVARLYPYTAFGKGVGALFGGYEGSLAAHKIGGVILLILFAAHLVYLAVVGRRSLSGPDSLLPCRSDAAHFIQHVKWMLGFGPPPRFERWGYWEKFDYWAVFWGMIIIGGTGLIMMFPVSASAIMDGRWINVARWVHRLEALLAMGHIFIIHFFIGHLRPACFPMDTTIFEGSTDITRLQHEKEAWVERLRTEGRMAALQTGPPSPALRISVFVMGFAAIATGVFLLVMGLSNFPFISW